MRGGGDTHEKLMKELHADKVELWEGGVQEREGLQDEGTVGGVVSKEKHKEVF